MRLYGKNFSAIWRDIPLPYRIVVVAGSAFLVFAFIYLLMRGAATATSALEGDAGPLTIRGAVATNYLDPSLASDGSGMTALAYTGIMADGSLRISLATSDMSCEMFRQDNDIFSSKPEALLAPDGTTELAQGIVRYETPSLVYDAADTATPWKIFAYRYFWMNNVAYAQRYSMIVMRSAATPRGPWGRENWLLSTAPDHPPPPYQNLIGTHINPLSPDLTGITGYARPSVISHRGALLMSLVAFRGSAAMERVILLASANQGRSWVYTGTLLTAAQVPSLGPYTQLTGASLVQHGGQLYLAAVLGDAAVQGLGTSLFRITDPATATLERNSNGVPQIAQQLDRQSTAPTSLGGGFAAYTQGCRAGIVTSEYSGLRNSYQLFRTLQTPPGSND